jgi:hypothetical protein
MASNVREVDTRKTLLNALFCPRADSTQMVAIFYCYYGNAKLTRYFDPRIHGYSPYDLTISDLPINADETPARFQLWYGIDLQVASSSCANVPG